MFTQVFSFGAPVSGPSRRITRANGSNCAVRQRVR
jgi:hypothetical protein